MIRKIPLSRDAINCVSIYLDQFVIRPLFGLWHVIFFLLATSVFSQNTGTVKGTVRSDGNTVPFANAGIKGLNIGAASDVNGNFVITNVPEGERELIISTVGYEKFRQTIHVISGKVVVVDASVKQLAQELNQVVVTGTLKETFITMSPVKVEVLTSKFLQKMPSSNIMQAMETVNGVQEQINCGVCGTSDIHINGMEGPYTLVLIDGMPIMSALSSVYGLNGIPTSLIDRIEIIKGPSSTLYGTEAVGGIINVITKKPDAVPLVSLNTFGTTDLEANTDFSFAPKVKKAKMLFSGNYYRLNNFMDKNNDNFSDIPLVNRLSLFNKWSFERNDGKDFTLSAKFYNEERFGGVKEWTRKFRGSNSIYGEHIYTNRYELLGSYELPVKEKIRWNMSFNHHRQDSYYGATKYNGTQTTLFSNLLWNKKIYARNDLMLGYTFRYNFYDDNTKATPAADKIIIPGIFAQNEFSMKENLTLLAGLRYDYHKYHGSIFSPRLNIKYKPETYTTLRFNSGTGFRVVNLFTEEHAALTGARTVVIASKLNPEESFNANFNINHVFNIGATACNVDGDLFYTYFKNKIIPDYETDKRLIIYDNLPGHAVSRGASVSFNQNFKFPLKISAGATYLDVFSKEKNNEGITMRITQVFVPEISGVWTVSYHFPKARLMIDYTGKAVGPMHLPTFAPPFERPENSAWFTLQNIQFTKKISSILEMYAGARNIFNYTQSSPLIDPQNPFGPNFDTAYAYGPLQGRRYFLGLRMNL